MLTEKGKDFVGMAAFGGVMLAAIIMMMSLMHTREDFLLEVQDCANQADGRDLEAEWKVCEARVRNQLRGEAR